MNFESIKIKKSTESTHFQYCFKLSYYSVDWKEKQAEQFRYKVFNYRNLCKIMQNLQDFSARFVYTKVRYYCRLSHKRKVFVALALCIIGLQIWWQLWKLKRAPLQSAKTAIIPSYSTKMHCSIGIGQYLSANMMAVVDIGACSTTKC